MSEAPERLAKLEELYEVARQDAKEAEAYAEELEARLAKAENGLFTLSHIHDGNPSDARADILPLDYARHMLWEARSIARTTLAELKGETDG